MYKNVPQKRDQIFSRFVKPSNSFFAPYLLLHRFFCVRLTINIGLYSSALDACQLDPCPDPYSICSISDSGERKCECPAICPKIYSPVCGSDGNNYSNECQMKVSACRQGMMIKVTSQGQCRGKLDFIALCNSNLQKGKNDKEFHVLASVTSKVTSKRL